MNRKENKVKALGLCSGGLDSILAGVVLRDQVDVVWVSFETPFFSAEKATKASEKTGIDLIVKDITDVYLPMLKNPPAGYGQHMNPCMDCHALMFRMACRLLEETGASFLFSGEVLGQRPMSQTRSSLRYVEKHSGCDGLILRPLSARRMQATMMEEKGWVDREKLLDISGRSRKPQIALARKYGISDYPAPAGGCLLTDSGFSRRLRDLLDHMEHPEKTDLELLKYGRHFRISQEVKLVVGRNKSENEKILPFYRPGTDILIRTAVAPGPVCLIPGGTAQKELIEQCASICAGYSRIPGGNPAQVRVMDPGRETVINILSVPPEAVGDIIVC